MLLTVYNPAAAAPPYKILVLPFTVHSDKDLSFLAKGVEDMLSSRLALKDERVLIEKETARRAAEETKEPIDEQTAVSIAAGLGADYVVFGSLTVFGDSVSTDARFLDVHEKRALTVFNQAGSSHGDIIQHIDLFAKEVSQQVFGQKTPGAQAQTETEKPIDDRHAHPEKLWTGDVRIDEREDLGGPDETGETATALWKSRSFTIEIKGMAVGDVDGNGKKETVFISENKIFIYRAEGSRFNRVREIEGTDFDHFLGVDVADINQNGVSEIFITNYFQKKKLSSFVLEWDGRDFSRIAKDENWYFRVVRQPEPDGVHLYGQKRGAGSKDLFLPGVYELVWVSGAYSALERQPLPREAMVFGFASGNVLNDGRKMVALFTQTDHIRILDPSGREEWKSIDPYGGGAVFLEFPDEFHREETDRLYLPQRIHVADIDGDGNNELVVASNEDSAGRLLTRTRLYKSGRMECLLWDNFGFYPKWRTRRISGHISDSAIGDFDNDGSEEIVFSVVSKGGMFSLKDKSYIVSWKVRK